MSPSIGSPFIFRIANETLADIFLLNANRAIEHWDASRRTLITDHDPRRTTRYSSQVCQRWCDVALGYASLWSRIIRYDKDPLPWIDELLRRSHPLTFELGQVGRIGPSLDSVGPQLPILSHAMRYAQRLKTVNIGVKPEAWREMCEGILQIEVPNLEYLHLTNSSQAKTLVFTGSLFSGNAPCLRRLHLYQCFIDLSSTTLSNLTELSVEDVTSSAPTVDAWLNILGNMPFLRWLTIVDAISGPLPTCFLPTVCLPNLSCLSIEANFLGCIALVDHIVCPPSGALRLKCIGVTSGPTLRRLSSTIEERLNLWRTPAKADRNFVFKCLSLEEGMIWIGNSNEIGRRWNVNESEDVDEVLEDPVLSIQLCFATFEEMDSSALPFLLSFSHVFTTVCRFAFWLDFTTEHMFDRLLGTLLLLNNVEEINLLEDSFINFLPPLQTLSHTGASAPTIPFASLRTIRLTQAEFHAAAFAILVSYLQYRQRILAPIGTLEIIFGRVSSEQREVLQRLTGDLKIRALDGKSDE